MMILNHEARNPTGIVLERIKNLPPGGKMGDLPEHLQHESFIRKGEKKTGGPNLRLLRLENDKPALTVTAYIFNKFVHPAEDRFITPREAACLQDFPVDYEFCGTLGQVQKQIGNAVPVKLAQAIARSVLEFFEDLQDFGEKTIFSYFTGAGGFDLGFENVFSSKIKFKTVFSTDVEFWAEETIKKNRPEWNFCRADIRELKPKKIIEDIKKPDIIIGGPPCQPFSVAGKQKGLNDPLGVLYRNYIEHIEVLSPKIVIMENVYGLAQVKSANMVKEIFKSFEKIGYELVYKELFAADYGTPQKRRRLFFVAAKNIKKFRFPEPTHSEGANLFGLPKYVGVKEAFSKIKN